MYRLMLIILVLSMTTSCATKSRQMRDTPIIETIRLNITKVRNAIEETRATIAVSRGAPYLPELYVRLAELLSEEARYHYQLAFEREQRQTRTLHVPQVRLLKEESINTYELVLSRFPDSPLVPQVLFNIGHEHRELGNFDEMRKVLNQLVDNHPESPLRANALLVLGDYHFDRNELTEAQGYYESITKGPLAPVSGLGHYKLAWVWVNNGECSPALTNFEDAIEKSNEWEARRIAMEEQEEETPLLVAMAQQARAADEGASQQDIDVRKESLVDMAYCYSRLKKAEDSTKYYAKMAYNRSTYVAALAKLASRYRTMDQFTGAILTTRELLRLAPASAELLDDARTLYTAIKRLRDYTQIGDDAELITTALTRYYTRLDVDPEERDRLVKEFELYVRDLATSAQERMEKKQKKAGSPAQVAKAYQAHVETFPQANSRADMLQNLAGVLSSDERNLEAGLYALQASDLIGDDTERRDALYDAVVYLQTSLKGESNRNRYERVSARAALRRAGASLLSYKLSDERKRIVKFAIAQAVYDEGLYVEAIDKLAAVAYEFPKTTEGDAAIRLALDSFNTLNDYDGLMYASRRYLGASSPASDELKQDIKRILAATEQRKLDELSLKAAGDEGADLSVLVTFAEKNQGSELGERALINAFVAARAMGDTDAMYEIADSMAKSYPKSDQLPGIYSTLAQAAAARFDFDQAGQSLRRAAEVNPSQRIQLLVAASELNEQMGNTDRAGTILKDAMSGTTGAALIEPLGRYASLLERTKPGSILSELSSYEPIGEPESLARIGLAKIAKGQVGEAEMNLQTVLNTETASDDARARAQYGMAEVMLATLMQYPIPTDIGLVEEFIILIEVTQQGYLNAARQGSPQYAAASLARLAHATELSAEKLAKVRPEGLSPEQAKQVQDALAARAEGLRAQAKEAVDACANLAWSTANFSPVVRECMKGRALKEVIPANDKLTERKGAAPQGIDELRSELSKNPEDVDKLRELGEKFLDGGDPHSARLVFARAIQVGGGALEQNLLGVASFQIGDYTGAFEAFVRAAEGGVEAGRKNLMRLLQEVGLSNQVETVNTRFQAGRDGGRTL